MPNGIIIIHKPQDWTSMDVCAKLRGVFHEKRVGHGGTLDPMATGVLPVFLGRATRAVQFAETGEKEYLAALRLGLTTDTQDTTGNVLEERPVNVSREELEAALAPFRGDILQLPPMYSAVKIGGKRLYELARKGQEVERKPRPVTIHALELQEELSPQGDFLLRVRCSKGTYIRTLCHDIGEALGCGGCMASLVRTEACGFLLSEAIPLSQVVDHPQPASLLRPVDHLFRDRPALTVSAPQERKLRNGMALPMAGLAPGEYRVYGARQVFLALCRAERGRLITVKNFFDPSGEGQASASPKP
jgi:tRNA pseudouridine55 synthase